VKKELLRLLMLMMMMIEASAADTQQMPACRMLEYGFI
jgi:hypothetical protein